MKNFTTFSTGRFYNFPQVIEAAIIGDSICPITESLEHVVYFKDDSRGLDYLITIHCIEWFSESHIMRYYDSNESFMKKDPDYQDRAVFEAIKEAQAI
jgi:hypothetical protein